LGCLNTRGCGSRSALRTALSGVTFSAQGRTDGVHQLLARRPLPHVSQRTGLETKLHQQRIAMNGHEHDPCGALLWRIGAAAAIPVETRHRDVADDHIGRQLLGGEHQRQTVVHLSDHFELRLEQPGQECPGLPGDRGSSARRPCDCSSLPDRRRPPDRVLRARSAWPSSSADTTGAATLMEGSCRARHRHLAPICLEAPSAASGNSEVLRVTWRLLSAFCHSIQAVSASFDRNAS
jgi:hypothetical protein